MDRPKKSYSAPIQKHRQTRYSSGNVIYEVYNSGSRRFNRFTNLEMFVLAIMAGGFMCLASLLSLLLMTDVASSGVQSLLAGLAFSVGFLFILVTHSVLVTEANVYVPGNFYHSSMMNNCLKLFRFWVIAWVGNVIGAFLFAWIIYLSQDYAGILKQNLINLSLHKLGNLSTFTYRGTGELILSGMLANWIIALVGFFAFASRNLINQFIISFLAFTLIAATNFQYFPINVSYFSLNTFFAHSISLSDAFFYNLIPVTMGNILGASLLVAGMLLYLSKKRQ